MNHLAVLAHNAIAALSNSNNSVVNFYMALGEEQLKEVAALHKQIKLQAEIINTHKKVDALTSTRDRNAEIEALASERDRNAVHASAPNGAPTGPT